MYSRIQSCLFILMSFMLIIFLKSNAQAQTQRNPPVFCDKYQEIDFPRVKIRVNIHFILDINGNNNYTPTDNGLGNASRNGIFAANKIFVYNLDLAHSVLGAPNNLFLHN